MSGITPITPTSFIQTQNGKQFYFFSGAVGVDDNDTTLIDIANIGEHDTLITFNCGSKETSGDDITMIVKNDGIEVFEDWIGQRPANNGNNNTGPYHFTLLIPANTSLLVTLYNMSSSTAREWFIAGHGKYLSI